MANEVTSANTPQAIVKYVAAQALPALAPNFVMAGLVNRNYDNYISNAGDTVNVPIAPTLTANSLVEAGTVTNQNPSLGSASVVLNQHIESTFVIPNVTQALASPDLLNTYLQPAVLAVAERIEADLLNLYSLLTFNASSGSANTPLTEATVDTAESSLFTARVPDNVPKFGILSATAYGQLRQISRVSEQRMTGDGSPILSGMLTTQVKGINFVRSQKVITSGTTTNNLVFARDAFVLVTRPLPPPIPGTGAVAAAINLGGFGMRVVMTYNANVLAQQFTIDVLYGVAVLRNQFGLLLLS